jgi:hypothetical protein
MKSLISLLSAAVITAGGLYLIPKQPVDTPVVAQPLQAQQLPQPPQPLQASGLTATATRGYAGLVTVTGKDAGVSCPWTWIAGTQSAVAWGQGGTDGSFTLGFWPIPGQTTFTLYAKDLMITGQVRSLTLAVP